MVIMLLGLICSEGPRPSLWDGWVETRTAAAAGLEASNKAQHALVLRGLRMIANPSSAWAAERQVAETPIHGVWSRVISPTTRLEVAARFGAFPSCGVRS